MSRDPAYAELIRLADTPGVRLAVASSGDEGLVLHAEGMDQGIRPAAAALGAAVYARARSAAAACGHGEPRLAAVRCADGQLMAAATGAVVLVVIADASANTGRIRLELLRAAGGLA